MDSIKFVAFMVWLASCALMVISQFLVFGLWAGLLSWICLAFFTRVILVAFRDGRPAKPMNQDPPEMLRNFTPLWTRFRTWRNK